MATGLRVPVGVNRSGGAALEDAEEQLRKVLILALSPGEDDNPFQNLGIPENFVFSINDPGTVGLIRQTVRRILAKFADRIALKPGTQVQVTQDTKGELVLAFEYIDLETSEIKDFTLVVP